MNDEKCLAVGWDAAGMLGRGNALAVYDICRTNGEFKYLGSGGFSFNRKNLDSFPIQFEDFLNLPRFDEIHFNDYSKVILAIDAPLAFPALFSEFLDYSLEDDFREVIPKNIKTGNDLTKQFFEPMGYRDIDIFIQKHFDKKFRNNDRPFSPVYSMITNQMVMVRALIGFWKNENDQDVSVPPISETSDPDLTVIEVYPKLIKKDGVSGNPVEDKFQSLFEELDVEPGTDKYDATISAVHALAYALTETDLDLPELVEYKSEKANKNFEFPKEEGWIYHFTPKKCRK